MIIFKIRLNVDDIVKYNHSFLLGFSLVNFIIMTFFVTFSLVIKSICIYRFIALQTNLVLVVIVVYSIVIVSACCYCSL